MRPKSIFLRNVLLITSIIGSLSYLYHLFYLKAESKPMSSLIASSTKYLTVAASSVKQDATLIFIHGLGDSGWGWEPVANILKADASLGHIKWILPHAGRKAITLNQGQVMPAWFDFRSFESEAPEDEEGMLESSKFINELIAEEMKRGTPANRIVLGGFSQGGAMTLVTGMTTETKLAGLVVMSGWLPISMRGKIGSMMTEHSKKVPIFWGHGEEDPLITLELAKESKEFLNSKLSISDASELGSVGLSFNTYKKMGHSAEVQELEDLKRWLRKVVPKLS